MFVSAYIAYAGVFNSSYRRRIKNFFKKKAEDLKLSIHKIEFVPIVSEILNLKKNKDLLLLVNPFDEYVKENFILCHYNPNKTPFVIDHYRFSKTILAEYYEKKESKKIIVTKPNDTSFLENVEKAMKQGLYLFVEQAEEKTYAQLKNIIKDQKVYKDGKICYLIDNSPKEVNEKFKMIFIKDKLNCGTNSKTWLEMQMLNFNPSRKQIKFGLLNYLIQKEDVVLHTESTRLEAEILKLNFTLSEAEDKIHEVFSQFDFSGNVEKNINNQTLNDKIRTEYNNFTYTTETMNGFKLKFKESEDNISMYELLTEDLAYIWKLMTKFNLIDSVYNFSFVVFKKFMVEFYNTK